MRYVAFYIASVVLVNWGFSTFPGYEWFWSIVIGGVFITRDYCQRAVGHWCVAAMAIAGLLSYWMADPFVAIASVCAFVFLSMLGLLSPSLVSLQIASKMLAAVGLWIVLKFWVQRR